MYKKLIAFVMSFTMIFGATSNAFANTPNEYKDNRVKLGEEIVYVDDGEGNLIQVVITEYDEYTSNSSPATRGILPDYTVGTIKSYDVKISNQQLGAPAAGAAAIQLTAAMKKKAVAAAGEAIAKKIGSKFIPGLNIASTILGLVSWGNGQLGKTGFQFSVKLIYSSVYIHGQGHDMYGWDIKSASIKTY